MMRRPRCRGGCVATAVVCVALLATACGPCDPGIPAGDPASVAAIAPTVSPTSLWASRQRAHRGIELLVPEGMERGAWSAQVRGLGPIPCVCADGRLKIQGCAANVIPPDAVHLEISRDGSFVAGVRVLLVE